MERRKRIIKLLLPAMLMTCLVVMSSCEKYAWAKPEIPQDLVVSYSVNIFPFCQSCHGAWSEDRAYDKLFENVDTVTPASSRVLSIHSSITAFGSQMLQVDTLLLPAPDVIKIWASQGAERD
jgi:hypothetical protein